MTSLDLAESNYSGLYYLTAAIAGLLVFNYIQKKSDGTKLPPGPPAYPFIGNLPQMGDLPHQSLMNLTKKYGPLMFMQLGSVPTIVVQSPEIAKEVLRTQDQLFASRPDTVTGEIFFYNRQDLLFAPLGPTFRLLRKTCINSLFTPKRIEHFKDVRQEEIRSFLQELLQESRGGKPVHLDGKITEMNFNNVSRILYGKSYYGLKMKNADGSTQARNFHEIAAEWAAVAGSVIIGDYLPYLRRFDIGGCERHLLRLRGEFNEFLTAVIDEHKRRGRAEVGEEDFVDVLLSLPVDEDGHSLSELQVKAFLQDLTLGGIDSSAAQMQWTLVELMRHPEVRFKVQDELDTVIGKNKMVKESDLARLPYLKAMLKESFRLHPAVPFLAPHENIEATKIAGYDIPNKTRVLVNLYAIHRSPDIWENPLKFDPSRFMNAKNTAQGLKGDDFKLIPFGAGRRMCPGMDYALLVVELTLAQLLHTCDLSLPDGVKPEDVDVGEKFGVTLATRTPLKVVLTPRLPSNVYLEAGVELVKS